MTERENKTIESISGEYAHHMPQDRTATDLDELFFRERLSTHAGSLSPTKDYYWNLNHIALIVIGDAGSRREDDIIRNLTFFNYRLIAPLLARGKLLRGDVLNKADT